MLCSSANAIAQCAPGIPGGGNPSCVPPSVFYDSLPPTSPPPSLGPQWETRWGAIVSGGGGFGASVNMPSKRKAEKIALKQCKDSGGRNLCTVKTAYYNQCAAIAWGENSEYAVATALTADISQMNAVKGCSDLGVNCKIFYSGCSYPVRIR